MRFDVSGQQAFNLSWWSVSWALGTKWALTGLAHTIWHCPAMIPCFCTSCLQWSVPGRCSNFFCRMRKTKTWRSCLRIVWIAVETTLACRWCPAPSQRWQWGSLRTSPVTSIMAWSLKRCTCCASAPRRWWTPTLRIHILCVLSGFSSPKVCLTWLTRGRHAWRSSITRWRSVWQLNTRPKKPFLWSMSERAGSIPNEDWKLTLATWNLSCVRRWGSWRVSRRSFAPEPLRKILSNQLKSNAELE